jgi:hypothetical protein
LDECSKSSHTIGAPSAREEVLGFIGQLAKLNLPNLFICVTSRPEQDILTTRDLLDLPTFSVYQIFLHKEIGQQEDIDNYIRSFIGKHTSTDSVMQEWTEDDKKLVINELSEGAGGM